MHVARRGHQGARCEGFTLLEVTIVSALMTVVIGMVFGFLVASNRAVTVSSVRTSNTADARTAIERLARTIQFATSLSISADHSQLYALQPDGTTCDEWFVSAGNLMLKVGSGTPSAVIRGVTAPAAAFASNSAYPDLVSVRLTVDQNSSLDPLGTSVTDTFLAENDTVGVLTKSGC